MKVPVVPPPERMPNPACVDTYLVAVAPGERLQVIADVHTRSVVERIGWDSSLESPFRRVGAPSFQVIGTARQGHSGHSQKE